MIFSRCILGTQGSQETLYSLLFPLLPAPKVIRRLNFQRAVFGRCQFEDSCVFQLLNGTFRLRVFFL